MTKAEILKRVVDMRLGDGSYVDMSKYNDLVARLEQDIRDENNKKSGKANVASLAKAIIKNGAHPMMKYACTKNDIQYVLDGYRIAGFYNNLDLPEYNPDDFGGQNWYNVDRIIEGVEYDDEQPLTLPTKAELESNIKIAKAKKRKDYFGSMWVFDNGVIVDAQYLLDYIKAFPDMKVYSTVNNPKVNPVYIEAEEGMGILLPIKGDEEPGFHTK